MIAGNESESNIGQPSQVRGISDRPTISGDAGELKSDSDLSSQHNAGGRIPARRSDRNRAGLVQRNSEGASVPTGPRIGPEDEHLDGQQITSGGGFPNRHAHTDHRLSEVQTASSREPNAADKPTRLGIEHALAGTGTDTGEADRPDASVLFDGADNRAAQFTATVAGHAENEASDREDLSRTNKKTTIEFVSTVLNNVGFPEAHPEIGYVEKTMFMLDACNEEGEDSTQIVIDGKEIILEERAAWALKETYKKVREVEAQGKSIDCLDFAVLLANQYTGITEIFNPANVVEAQSANNNFDVIGLLPVEDSDTAVSLPCMQPLVITHENGDGTHSNDLWHAVVKLPTQSRQQLFVSKLGGRPLSGSGNIVITNLVDIGRFYGSTHVAVPKSIVRSKKDTEEIILSYTNVDIPQT